jgi:hypothetical protein
MIYRKNNFLFLIYHLREDHYLIYVYSLPIESELELIKKRVRYNIRDRRKLILYS